MATIDPRTEDRLRQGFKKYLNPFMLTMWRLGLGTWFKVCPEISGSVMVLTHIGRKTGIKRYQPLNFAIVDDDIYCVAAFGDISDWYRNIRANPNVEVGCFTSIGVRHAPVLVVLAIWVGCGS
jgi:hypothetical protein